MEHIDWNKTLLLAYVVLTPFLIMWMTHHLPNKREETDMKHLLTQEAEGFLDDLEKALELQTYFKDYHSALKRIIAELRDKDSLFLGHEQAYKIKELLAKYTCMAQVEVPSTATTFFFLWRRISAMLRKENGEGFVIHIDE